MTNDTYLKMCLALDPKVFEGWNWQEGDKLVRTYAGTPTLYYIGDCVLVRDNPTEPFEPGFTYGDEGFCKYDGEIRPIPSQEQLQKICMKLIQCSPKDLLRFFEAWLYEDEIRPVVDFEDFDDLWLKYTVWVWGRMEWNGSEWI